MQSDISDSPARTLITFLKAIVKMTVEKILISHYVVRGSHRNCRFAAKTCMYFTYTLTNRLSFGKTSPLFSKSKNLQSLKKYDVCGGPECFAERIFWSRAFAAEEHVRTKISLIFIQNTHLVAVQHGNHNFTHTLQKTLFWKYCAARML